MLALRSNNTFASFDSLFIYGFFNYFVYLFIQAHILLRYHLFVRPRPGTLPSQAPQTLAPVKFCLNSLDPNLKVYTLNNEIIHMTHTTDTPEQTLSLFVQQNCDHKNTSKCSARHTHTCPPFTHKHCKASSSSVSVSFLLSFSLSSSPLHTHICISRHAFQVCRKNVVSLCRGRRQSTLFWSLYLLLILDYLLLSLQPALRTVFDKTNTNQYPHRHSQQFRDTHTLNLDLLLNWSSPTHFYLLAPADLMAKDTSGSYTFGSLKRTHDHSAAAGRLMMMHSLLRFVACLSPTPPRIAQLAQHTSGDTLGLRYLFYCIAAKDFPLLFIIALF